MFVHILEGFNMSRVKIWGRFDLKDNSLDNSLRCPEPTRAIQSQKDEADINNIVRNFGVTGKVKVSVVPPTYGNFHGVDDYQSALHAIKEAEAAFMAMPSDVRKRFDNDPGLFVDFCSDRANLEEMRKLGLAVPAPAPLGASGS